MSEIQVKVPDIGDFKDVAVIEVLVQPGDTVKVEQSLITVESDKASMEIPSSHAGVVKSLAVKLGDTVNEGSVVLTLEVSAAGSTPSPAGAGEGGGEGQAASPAAAPSPQPSPASGRGGEQLAPAAVSFSGQTDLDCDVVVLGGGPGGYSAAFRAADLGLKVFLVERYAQLGGVCLNVGCIPSKALLHVATVMDEVSHLAALGIDYGGAPKVDIDKLRAHKEKVIGKLTGGLGAMAKMRKVTIVRGYGSFVGAHHIEVEETGGTGQEKTGKKQVVQFKRAIIAAGSQAVRLPFMPEDPRVVDSTGALALKSVPKKMLVLGGGIIGLEMGTVYSTLGTRLDVVEMLDGLMQGADRDLVKVWQKLNAPRFDHIMLKTKTVAAKATDAGIEVSFEGENAPAPQTYDLVLQAVGRSPNGKKIGADKAGVAVTDRGFINVDVQMRTNVPHIFAIGDIVGQPMMAHKAVHEAHVAAEVAAGHKAAFDATVIPGVAYTHPEVAWVGTTEDQARKEGRLVETAKFPWAASGRAIANGAEYGFTKLIFDAATHRIIGGAIVGPSAGDMIGEVCLAIEMGCDAVDIGQTIHPHPTLGETIGMAAEVAHGSCTDIPPARKK